MHCVSLAGSGAASRSGIDMLILTAADELPGTNTCLLQNVFKGGFLRRQTKNISTRGYSGKQEDTGFQQYASRRHTQKEQKLENFLVNFIINFLRIPASTPLVFAGL